MLKFKSREDHLIDEINATKEALKEQHDSKKAYLMVLKVIEMEEQLSRIR